MLDALIFTFLTIYIYEQLNLNDKNQQSDCLTQSFMRRTTRTWIHIGVRRIHRRTRKRRDCCRNLH